MCRGRNSQKFTGFIKHKTLLAWFVKNDYFLFEQTEHPLFEVCFALEDGNTAFHPSMSSDGFYYLVENLIYDVYSTTALIPRISMTNRISYMVLLIAYASINRI